MSRAFILVVLAFAFLGLSVYALSKYAYPEYIRLKEKHLETQASLKERQLERDEALVEEAEREREERK